MRTRSILLLTTVLTCSAWGQTYTISTLAGTGMPVNVPGTSASLGYGSGLNKGTQYIAADPAGNVFFPYGNTVLRLDATTGMLTLSAGNGTPGFSGDNGPASSAQLNSPAGVAVDSAGNLYIADTQNQRIRKVSNGVITTLAGNGTYGFSGDNGPATSAQLNDPSGIAVDSAGNLYVCESIVYQRIRKVSNGVITTVAGGGSSLGDNGPAISAQLNQPEAVAVDSAGNLYIADTFNNRIRKVSGGVITTVAGNGTPVNSGDNGPATSAGSGQPNSVAVDSAGNLYIAANGDSIRKVSGGFITTVAGGGGTLGDDGPATSGQLQCSCAVAVDSADNLYIADSFNERIRKVSGGVISTVAGNGTPGLGGDNGPATSGQLYGPAGVAVDSAGNVYIADTSNFLVRKVAGGVITTVAGGGSSYLGDNVPAASVHLYSPSGVAVDSAGNLYIADTGNQIVRKVWGGVITTVAGSGASIYGGFSGDNGPATSAQLSNPAGVAVDAAGNLYIADSANDRIRKVSNGVITTVVGTGTPGFAGDNGPATSAELSAPNGIAVDSAGNLYIADTGNGRIRKVSNGVITTVAGGGSSLGDNGPATSAQIGAYGVAVDSAGNLYIADGARVRKVANGVITTVAGNGTAGFGGDNGPATSAQLANATGVAVDSAGNLYVADKNNYRIRVLTPVGSACTYSVSPTTLPAPASGGSLTVGIQAAPSCPWAISGLPGWITASATSSGPGSASVALAVFPNNSGATLSGTVLIAGVSVTVIQPAAAAAPLPPIKSVVNAASFIGGPVSPGEMVTIFGTGIGPSAAAYATRDPATGKLATTIGGVQVLFNGTPAPMIYASSTQVSAVVPYEMAVISNPSVWIAYAGQTSNAYRLSLAASAPGLFAQNSSGSGLGAILNQDNSLNGPGNPAAKGSIVQMFMTGEGQTSPRGVTGTITSVTLPPPQVTPAPLLAPVVQIDGRTALSTYAGEAPGMAAGVMQLNVQIPANAGSGALPIQVWFLFNVSQSGITVAVQ
jgi:uncharacterized protein (TIGR03437 family)